MSLPRKAVEIDVATRKNDANGLAGNIQLTVQHGCEGNGTARFDHDLQRLPSQPHCADNGILRHIHNVVHMTDNQREG